MIIPNLGVYIYIDIDIYITLVVLSLKQLARKACLYPCKATKEKKKQSKGQKGRQNLQIFLFHQFSCTIDSAQGISLQLPKHVAALSA